MEQLPLAVRLRDTARLDSFVPGRNREALESIGTGSRATPKVLWLWGRPGTGKTHLLQGACAAVAERGGSASYLDLAAAEPGWLEGCENLDLVCLDGIDFVTADATWNEAIF